MTTQDEESNEELIQYEPNKVTLRVKRHINMGDRTFQNAETSVFNESGTNLTEQLEKLREAREALNIWESEERANYRLMQKTIQLQEEAAQEKERVADGKQAAEFRETLLDFIESNPNCGTDDLVLTFEISEYQLSSHIDALVRQGKIKRAQCRESYQFSMEEEDPDETI